MKKIKFRLCGAAILFTWVALASLRLAPTQGPLRAQASDKGAEAIEAVFEAVELMDEGRPGQALRRLDRVKSKIDPDYRWYWWGTRAGVLATLRRPVEALDGFDRCMELEPKAFFHSDRALLLHHFGRGEQALADLDAEEMSYEEFDERLADDYGDWFEEDEDRDALPQRRARRKTAGQDRLLRQEPEGDDPEEEGYFSDEEFRAMLRQVILGPNRERWPHAWPKREALSDGGRWRIVSELSVSDDEMDRIDAEAAGLDPEDLEHAARLRELLAPSPDLQALADLMDEVHCEYRRALGVEDDARAAGLVLKAMVFASYDTLTSFTESFGQTIDYETLGFYDENFKFLALYDDDYGDRHLGLRGKTYPTLFHEGFHQFFDTIAWERPVWLDEGIAEYLGTGRATESGVELALLDRFDFHGHTNYFTIKRSLLHGWALDFGEFFALDDETWAEGDFEVYYAQAWSISWYAMRGDNAAFRKDYLALLKGLQEGKRADELLEELFTEEELEAWQAAWEEYFLDL